MGMTFCLLVLIDHPDT
uniref:Uncharacterized protein n=1 Tax=Arundo donax TaxID=35708 RepID=A0A0A9HK02_ARUDO